MAGLYWRIYYQIETPRIGELKWRETADRRDEMKMVVRFDSYVILENVDL